ncbi:hypothetical protein GF323_02145, partial [Candidatus Woesearchaeota archaeon]|nr:hypothetical protein [Candidatus Woesearchaeota archaeon]
MTTQTAASTLEHKVLGLSNFANNINQFTRMDSVAEIQARRARTPLDELEPEISPEAMQRQWYYGSDIQAHSIRDGDHIMELYDLNDEEHFSDRLEVVRTLRNQGYQISKLQDLEDKTRVVNLSDWKLNTFVTKDNNDYSYITFKISDVVQGKAHFEKTYGAEATKIFTSKHGEDVYSEQGVKGRFREDQEETFIYFQNQSVTEARLRGQEKGAKVLRGAYLDGL